MGRGACRVFERLVCFVGQNTQQRLSADLLASLH